MTHFLYLLYFASFIYYISLGCDIKNVTMEAYSKNWSKESWKMLKLLLGEWQETNRNQKRHTVDLPFDLAKWISKLERVVDNIKAKKNV